MRYNSGECSARSFGAQDVWSNVETTGNIRPAKRRAPVNRGRERLSEQGHIETRPDLVSLTRRKIADGLSSLDILTKRLPIHGQLEPGKMLRTRLAARLIAGSPQGVPLELAARLCAATELAHTASLCHDDVIDNGLVRRSLPSLWRVSSPSGAVLLGDLLLCAAVDLLLVEGPDRYLSRFVSKMREVCLAEAEQELIFRGKSVSEETCIRIARSKTGALFAFAAMIAGGEDGRSTEALEEAGYRVGTAYQLADDLLDECGSESKAGKTLGTDRAKRKCTLAQLAGHDGGQVAERVRELCRSAVECLVGWPGLAGGMRVFFSEDLESALERMLGRKVWSTQ